jgi:pimeloyl-ACP methyl ester carboxylesterase
MSRRNIFPILLVWLLMFSTVVPTITAEETDPSKEKLELTKEKAGEEYRAALSGEGMPTLSMSDNRMYNEYLEYAVDSNGRFTLGTTGGDPNNTTDNNQTLTFGHPSPWSSYSTINIDGQFTPYAANQAPIFNENDLSHTSEQHLTDKNIKVKQVLKIVPSINTKREDTLEIKYIVTNHDDVNAHDVGVRVMLDTMLGGNDSAPFRIPGVGPVTTEMEFTGENIPEYWQGFDSLSNPKVIGHANLTRNSENKPDKVQFLNWGKVYYEPWNSTVSPGSLTGDSAVAMYWNLKSLAPGETREYVTHYGLSDLVQDLRPPVTLSITGPQKIQLDSNGAYTPNPSTVTAYFQNIGTAPAENVNLDLLVASGGVMKLSNGYSSRINVGTLQPGETRQVSWQVEFLPQPKTESHSYGVRLTSTNAETKELRMNVEVPAHQAKEKRVVIFLHGMVGSKMGSASDSYWIPDFGEFDQDLHHLRLDGNGESVEQIFVGGAIGDFYDKIYQKMREHDTNGDGNPDLEVHSWSYDWRMDLNKTAQTIERAINGLDTDKVSIVAHSMGGLVAAKYIANGNAHKIDKFITIGTPHLGAPKALYVFETGGLIGGINDWFVANGLKRLAPNMSSAYQLLPGPHYFSFHNSYYVQKITDRGWFKSPRVEKFTSYDSTKQYFSGRSWANQNLLNNSVAFQQALNMPATLRLVDSYQIAGYNMSTHGLIKEKYKQNGSYDSADFDPIDGDGTVPLISSTLGGQVRRYVGTFWDDYYYEPTYNPERTYLIKGVDHSDLQRNDTVIKQVLQILDGNPARVPGIDWRAKLSSFLKIRVESPVDLHVYDQEGNHVGPVDEFKYDENIPTATYTESGHTKTTVLENGTYKVELDGTGTGTATLILQLYNELGETVKTVRFDDVEVTPDTVITTTTDMNHPIQLVIDKNGDGNTVIMDPSAVLDGQGSQDETPPDITFDIEGEKSDYNWYKSDVKVSIHATDDESGVKKLEYRLNEGEIQLYDEPFKLTSEGTTKVEAVAYNHNRINSDGIMTELQIDKTVPEFNLHFDPVSKTFKVQAIDTLSGPVTEEITVTPTLRNKNDLEEVIDRKVHEDTQNILLSDKANNTLELQIVAYENGENAVLRILSLTYNDKEITIPITKVVVNYQHKNGVLHHLHQIYSVENNWKIVSNYTKAQNQTMIVTHHAGSGAVTEKKSGVIQLKLESNKGSFTYKK